MVHDHDLIVSMVAVLVNLILSLIIPTLFKNTEKPLLKKIRHNYYHNKNALILSSVTVFIFVYFSLKITPTVEKHLFSKIAQLANEHNLLPTN
jgi:uncharacterized protein involved in response to NO